MPSRCVSFKTLGCRLNQAETEAIAGGFKALGWEIAEFGRPVDAVVVNGCTVTNAADRKSRSAMNRALRITDKTLVLITGCYADGHRDALEADGRTYVIGNAHKSYIPQLVDAHFKGELMPGHLEQHRDPFGYPLSQPVFRTRAMVKVQDGCNNGCSFCIIPFVRGRAVSRPMADCVRAVEDAAASGYREIVLTGVNMSRWQEEGRGFTSLLDSCLNAEGHFRLRLGSLEPDRLDEGLIDLMSHPKMTPHLHLCLQSGSERILLAMRRQYTAAQYESCVLEIRRRTRQFNLTTDIIVGFPGETEREFSETAAMCERLKFGHIHTFPYSRRSGTRADSMDGQVSESLKKEWSEIIRGISVRSRRQFRKSLIGTVQDVLAEQVEGEGSKRRARGLSANYVPVRFFLPNSRPYQQVRGEMFSVRICGIQDEAGGKNSELFGEVWNHGRT
ncbi:MAG: tRNA (N(6)-L-threonylcarbamoyladenosine(37)-C(2))-methylthiotransferase MtaB [Spirochaeta sp. LUC14_002_19_P3]|nr:MAG: tRNA (N(6)-L-threonylcarbamoyladenosine(37)-C(2))-methylthiotransferase MtaB [Spirochaeta sp. LUC14_002_19_P3]